MKLVLVGPAHPFRGGIAQFLTTLYHHLEGRHEVEVVNFTRQYPGLLFPGRTQEDESAEPLSIRSVRLLDSVNPLSWRRTARFISGRAADWALFMYWMPFFAPAYGTVARRVKGHAGTRIGYLCHNIVPHEPSRLDRLLTKYGLAPVDHFFVLSGAVKNDLLRFRPDATFSEVPHPLVEVFGEPLTKETARRRLGLAADQPVVLFFGYVRAYKGLRYLLQALPRVRRRVPVQVLVAGEFYEPKDSYLRLVSDLGIGDAVRIEDRYIRNEEVAAWFSAADVVVQPYVSATQSGITQVAYQFDVPVITTDVGGLGEVVKHGDTGLVVPPEDPEALAAAIVEFFEQDLGPKMSAAIGRHKEAFSWQRLVEAIEALPAPSQEVVV